MRLPDKMLAAQYETSGRRRGELELVELPVPEAGPGEVLVRVRVSGVNPTDVRARSGGAAFDAGHARVVPHHDGAGEVAAVGAGVSERRVGERVWLYLSQFGRAQGTAAQWIALPAERAVALPDGVSFELGAGLGIPALTAHRCLYLDGPIDDQTVLVQGGAGAVGHAAIELARAGGARVAATVSSPEKGRLAEAAGAQLVVNYRTGDVVDAVRSWAHGDVHHLIEVAIAANVEADAQLIAAGRPITSYGAPDGPIVTPRALIARNSGIRFVLVYTMGEDAIREAVSGITRALRAAAMTELPAVRFGLEQIEAAHDAVREHVVGKVLLDIP